ncbi:hypothetical protein RB195_025851 [Necator americanus]|uniref:Uncharacterized protein n=1 Tax=Necator americanus TaxID=51031 RepID=A0ABR1EUA7_NECAM
MDSSETNPQQLIKTATGSQQIPKPKPFGARGFPPGPPMIPVHIQCTAMERVTDWFRRNEEWKRKEMTNAGKFESDDLHSETPHA